MEGLKLQDLIKKHGLKEGDEVVCVARPDNKGLLGPTFTENKSYRLRRGTPLEGFMVIINDYNNYTMSDDPSYSGYLFSVPKKQGPRHVHHDLYLEALADTSIVWQILTKRDGYRDSIMTGDVYFNETLEYRKKPSKKQFKIETLEAKLNDLKEAYVKEFLPLKNELEKLRGDLG